MFRRIGVGSGRGCVLWQLGVEIVLAAGVWGCQAGDTTRQSTTSQAVRSESAGEGGAMSQRPIENVQEDHTPDLMTLDGVLGTYIGQNDAGQPCIKVMVRKRTAEIEARIPSELEGYPVEIVESGEIRPLEGDSIQ